MLHATDLGSLLFLGVLAHTLGDYLLQSDWMATKKTIAWCPAIVHGVTYGIPFLAITWNPWALAVIVGTHIVIDRFRLARYLVWVKNFIAPPGFNTDWDDCKETGYPSDRPVWLATILMIIADNTIHVVINSAALTIWGQA